MGVRTAWELWRYLGAAIAAVMLASSQLQPNPLPTWVFPVVAVVSLVGVAVSFVVERRRDR